MDMNKTTQKVQEALQQAQVKALRFGHQEVDAEHVLFALLEQEGGLVPRLIEGIGASVPVIKAQVEQELEKRPRVQGATEAGKVYVTQRLNQLLVKAGDEAKKLKDEFVSVEHLLLVFAEEINLLKQNAVDRNAVLQALEKLRGNQRVTSDNPEGQYEALEKYGMDLVDAARAGKMDPVIGRDAEIRSVIRILSRKTKNNPV
ncbi:MAG: ATP-dependent chaperone ClpB, partial [Pontiella sp.]|nr:ATP-dependent chaperone ClpB [Pontiella sp.]